MATVFMKINPKWIVLGAAACLVSYLLYKNYQKIPPLNEKDKKILATYEYQLYAGNSKVVVKRNMIALGDRHLMPYIFPNDAPNEKVPKRKPGSKKRGNSNRNKIRGAKNSATYEDIKPEVVKANFPVQVFVRMRPLIETEIDEKHDLLQYATKTVKKKANKTLILKKAGPAGRDLFYKGLKNVILPKHDNVFTYKTVIAPCLDSLLKGEICASFAYGHSGSGKTHTMFGYGDEPGMYLLFGRELLDRVKNMKGIYVKVSFVELYQGKIRNLLNLSEEEISLKENEGNQHRIRLRPKFCADGKIRAYPITTVRINNESQLCEVVKEGIKSRNCGNSTIHDKSSRSHAFLEYEVVSHKLEKLRAEEVEVESDLLWYTTIKSAVIQGSKQTQSSALRRNAPKQFDADVEKYKKDWIGLNVAIGKYEKMLDHYRNTEKSVGTLWGLMNDATKPIVGKTMVFVDLAGNEFGRDAKGKRDLKEEKERKEINMALMALKECIRALSGGNRYHIPYRQSSLTRFMRRYLGEMNSRAVMISNIGSSQEMVKATINTLKYTKLVANV